MPHLPVIWSRDGSKLYVFTVSHTRDSISSGADPDEQRQMWIVDVRGTAAPIAVQLDVAVWDVVMAPSGHAMYILGYDTLGPSRSGFFKPGSTTLEALDAATGQVLSRVPLPAVKLATQAPGGRSYFPATALTQSGRYYLVAHADEPVIDVVDVLAPTLARLERTLHIGGKQDTATSTNAWLDVSPDGKRLYAHRFSVLPGSQIPTYRSAVPIQVIDIGGWTANTFDPTATYLRFSADGQYVYAIDPPNPSASIAPILDLPNAPGAGLRVLNTAGQLVSRLTTDRFPSVVARVSSKRLYVVQPGPVFAGPIYGPPGPSLEQDVYDLVDYETGSWHEIARRSWHLPIWLVTST